MLQEFGQITEFVLLRLKPYKRALARRRLPLRLPRVLSDRRARAFSVFEAINVIQAFSRDEPTIYESISRAVTPLRLK